MIQGVTSHTWHSHDRSVLTLKLTPLIEETPVVLTFTGKRMSSTPRIISIGQQRPSSAASPNAPPPRTHHSSPLDNTMQGATPTTHWLITNVPLSNLSSMAALTLLPAMPWLVIEMTGSFEDDEHQRLLNASSRSGRGADSPLTLSSSRRSQQKEAIRKYRHEVFVTLERRGACGDGRSVTKAQRSHLAMNRDNYFDTPQSLNDSASLMATEEEEGDSRRRMTPSPSPIAPMLPRDTDAVVASRLFADDDDNEADLNEEPQNSSSPVDIRDVNERAECLKRLAGLRRAIRAQRERNARDAAIAAHGIEQLHAEHEKERERFLVSQRQALAESGSAA